MPRSPALFSFGPRAQISWHGRPARAHGRDGRATFGWRHRRAVAPTCRSGQHVEESDGPRRGLVIACDLSAPKGRASKAQANGLGQVGMFHLEP